jgi:thiamine biosynthesis protein ThiI
MSAGTMRIVSPALAALREGPPHAPEFVAPDAIVVRYSEIFLKGENRRVFEDILVRNVTHAVAGAPGVSVRRHHARLVIRGPAGEGVLEEALPRVLRVFGVSSASLAITVPKDLDVIAARGAGALVTAARAAGAKTF